jgi:hypothetical protein
MLSEEEVFGKQAEPAAASSVLSDEEVFGIPEGKLSDEEVFGEQPGWIDTIGQGIASGVGSMADTAAQLTATGIQSLSNPISEAVLGDSTGVTDAIRDVGQDAKRYWGNLVLSEKEKRAQSLGQRVTGNLSSFAPNLLLGPAAVPAMGLQAMMQTGESAIDAGETEGKAIAAATLQGGASVAMAGLPAAAVTKLGTLRNIALGGPVAGYMTDAVTQSLLDNEEFAKQFDPLSLEARLTDTAGGMVFAVPHYRALNEERATLRLNQLRKDDPESYKRMIEEMKQETADLFRINELPAYRQPHETKEEALARLIEDRSILINRHQNSADPNRPVHISMAQALEVLYQNADNHQDMAKAKHMLDMSMDIGLDFAAIYNRPWVESDGTTIGKYQTPLDMATVHQKAGDSKADIMGTMLHEIQHAVHARLFSFGKYLKTADDRTLDPTMRRLKEAGLVEAYDKFLKFHEYVQKRVEEKGEDWGHVMSKPEEMLSGLFNSRATGDFVDQLRELGMKQHEIDEYMPKLNLPENHKYMEFNRAIRQSNDQVPSNALDVLLQNYANIAQHNSIGLRSQRVTVVKDEFGDDTGERTRREDVTQRVIDRKTAKDEFAERANANPVKKHLFRKLYNAIHSASSYEEFLTKARLASDMPEWTALLAEHGRTLYDRGQMFYDVRSELSAYRDLGQKEKLFALEDRTWEEFMRDERASWGAHEVNQETGKPIGDIGKLGTYFHNPGTIRLSKSAGFAGRVIKFMIDKAHQKAYIGNRLYHEMKAMSKEYDELPPATRRKVFSAVSFFDSTVGRASLVNQRLQWPTAEMLRGHGLSEVEISAYGKLTKAMDRAYDLLNQIHMKMYNGEQLKKVPGYMPHFHEGAFKVMVRHKASQKIVRVQGFDTAFFANKAAKNFMQDPQYEIQMDGKNLFHVSKYDDVGESLLDAYRQHSEAFFNLAELGQEGVREIQRAEDASMRDFGKHLLERSEVKGFTGEHGAEPNSQWKAHEKLAYYLFGRSKALEIHDRYFKSVAEAWKNTMFLADDYTPLMSIDTGYMNGRVNETGLFKHIPKAEKYLRAFAYNFIGKSFNHFEPIDNTLRDLSIKLGVSPHLYREFARSARNFLSLVKLRVNPANYWNNAVQPIHTLNWLLYSNAELGINTSPLKAFMKVMKDTYAPDDDVVAALRWAYENRILDPQLDAELASQKQSQVGKVANYLTLGKVNPAIEGFGRATSFLIAFEHYRTQFNGDVVRAREAAQLAMQQTMVNYDRTARPLMYQNFGVLGEMASPFAVFRNAYIGNTYLMFKLIYNNPKMLSAYAPLIMSQASYVMLAGAMGMVGGSEYDVIANLINTVAEDDIVPTLSELLYMIGAPDIVVWGGPANALKLFPGLEEGATIGQSGSAVGMDDLTSMAMMPFLGAVKEVSGLAVKSLASIILDTPSPSFTDLYGPAKQFIPSVLNYDLERQFKGPGGDEVAFKARSTEAMVPRTQAGKNAIRFTGKPSVDEANAKARERIIERSEALDKLAVAGLVTKAADRFEGLPTMDSMADLERKAVERGLETEEFHGRVLAEINRRRVDKRKRNAAAAAGGSVPAYRSYVQREKLEGSR